MIQALGLLTSSLNVPLPDLSITLVKLITESARIIILYKVSKQKFSHLADCVNRPL
jgi:hypothetical protein